MPRKFKNFESGFEADVSTKLLDKSYRYDKYLRDTVLTEMDPVLLKTALLDHISQTAQLLTRCIANRLSAHPRSSDTTSIHYISSHYVSQDNAKIYTARLKYCIAALWSINKSGIEDRSAPRISAHMLQKMDKHKRLNLSGMNGNEGSFVCGDDWLGRKTVQQRCSQKSYGKTQDQNPSWLSYS